MATKADNAAALKAALNVEIDPSASKPVAQTLQGWVDRLSTDKDTVHREILTSQLETELDIQIPGDAAIATLQDWLTRSLEDADGVKAEIVGPVAADPDAEPDLFVRVSPGVAAYDGTYTDPDQAPGRRVIGAEPVGVVRTAAIELGLKNQTLVLHTED